jgi:glycosyltransferase involved in cell wall biosynthesis
MNILVFDVPATSGGALTILEEYYKAATQDSDDHVMWFFVISSPELRETDNVRVLRFPWVKKSWLHRLYFDCLIAPRLVNEHEADEILSLQNVVIPKTEVPQTLYVHQPLPFVDKRFKLTEAPRFWVYQNIIGKMIFQSMRKASRVIVQTDWMRHACVSMAGIEPTKITVLPPSINVDVKRHFELAETTTRTFFYPASGVSYKNHSLIVDAAVLLESRGIDDYEVIFTLRGDENRHIRNLHHSIDSLGLRIRFVGGLARDQVFDYYSRSVLVFPSYIETFGLPLLEARLHGTPILASDCPFSHEILNGYEKAWFFGATDATVLADLMEASVRQETSANLR